MELHVPERKIYDNITFFSDNNFFSPQLILQKSNGQFQRSIVFQGSRWGPIFSRGSNFFQGVSNCLFPIETHILCDFPEGVRTPCPPPSGSAHAWCSPHSFMVKATVHYLIWAWQTLIDRTMYHPFIVIYPIISVYYRNLRCFNR